MLVPTPCWDSGPLSLLVDDFTPESDAGDDALRVAAALSSARRARSENAREQPRAKGQPQSRAVQHRPPAPALIKGCAAALRRGGSVPRFLRAAAAAGGAGVDEVDMLLPDGSGFARPTPTPGWEAAPAHLQAAIPAHLRSPADGAPTRTCRRGSGSDKETGPADGGGA
eukprot:gene5553-5898_t